jgi:hypothetical protein
VGENFERFSGRVVDQDEACDWVGPPPAERCVQRKTDQDGRGQDAIDKGDPALGAKDRVVEGFAGAGFPPGEYEHDYRGDCRPRDAGWAVVRMVRSGQDHRALNGEIDGESNERGADEAQRPMLP